jgi:hypothetical protein
VSMMILRGMGIHISLFWQSFWGEALGRKAND